MDQDWNQVVFTKTPKVDGKPKIKKEQDIDIEDVKKIQTISKENQEKIRTARTLKKIKQKDLAKMKAEGDTGSFYKWYIDRNILLEETFN